MSWQALNYYEPYQINLISFPAHDELGMCRTVLVSPEQPVLCMPVRPNSTMLLTVLVTWTLYTSDKVDIVPVCTTELFRWQSSPAWTSSRLNNQLFAVGSTDPRCFAD